jgi:RNA polymerase sigma-70 factor (sigma-E family)
VVVEFDEYVAARGQALLRFAYVLTGDAHLAEDLVQEALVRLHGRWRRVNAAEHPDAYVRRAVVNADRDRRRRRSAAEVPVDATSGWTDRAAHGDHGDALAERAAMWQALGSLPPRQRAVLVLRYYADCDDAAIGELLGCAEATVRSNAARALAALRAAWSAGPASADMEENTP